MPIQEDELEKKAEELKELTGQLQETHWTVRLCSLFVAVALQAVLSLIDIEEEG